MKVAAEWMWDISLEPQVSCESDMKVAGRSSVCRLGILTNCGRSPGDTARPAWDTGWIVSTTRSYPGPDKLLTHNSCGPTRVPKHPISSPHYKSLLGTSSASANRRRYS